MENKKIFYFLLFNFLFYMIGKGQNPIVQKILNEVNMDSLTFFVKQLTGEEKVIINGIPDTIFSRHKNQPGNEKAFQFVKQKFLGYGLQIDSFQFSASGKNLLGIKIGSIYPTRKFILGAHYDNVGSTIAPGADDNASGSAAVLEAARVFSESTFPFTIVFALWDEEEQGLIGSNAYSSFAVSNNETILGYINMDMLGWDGNNDSVADLHVRPVANSLQLADKAIESNSVYAIGLNLHIVNPGTGATDHAAFWDNGYTAIGINEEYDGDFNPFWHSSADSLGQFNLPFYEKCAKLAYATLADCALDSIISSGISDVWEQPPFIIYPNPASAKLNIEIGSVYHNNSIIQLTDVLGKIHYQELLLNKNSLEINLQNLQSGFYIIKFNNGQNSYSSTLVINK